MIAVIQISKEILLLCGKYYSGVKGAREDRDRLCDEVKALIGVLEQVQGPAKSPETTRPSVLDAAQVKKCSSELEELKKILDQGAAPGLMSRLKFRTSWPFKRGDVDKKIAILDRHKTTFNLALTADMKKVRLLFGGSTHYAHLSNL